MWRIGWAPNSIPIYIQQDATLHSLFIYGNCSTCFGWYFHPSSGAHTTVSTASGICHTVTAICRYLGRVGTGLSVLWLAYALLSRYTIFSAAVNNNKLLRALGVCLYPYIRYPASRSRLFCAIFYCHLWPVRLYHIVPHCLINRTVVERNIFEHEMCFYSSHIVLPESFLILEEFILITYLLHGAESFLRS
jgi:hypothetical protein